MTSPRTRARLSARSVITLIDRWNTAIIEQAPVTQLVPLLANGLLFETCHKVLRGIDEFTVHYSGGGWLPLVADHDIRVRLASPIHAEVAMTAPIGSAVASQLWWVVDHGHGPRIRSVAPARRTAALTTA